MSAYMLPDKAVTGIAERLGFCTSKVRLAGVTLTCDRMAEHEGRHGGTYPSADPEVDVTVAW